MKEKDEEIEIIIKERELVQKVLRVVSTSKDNWKSKCSELLKENAKQSEEIEKLRGLAQNVIKESDDNTEDGMSNELWDAMYNLKQYFTEALKQKE